jgi:hypothetical protein
VTTAKTRDGYAKIILRIPGAAAIRNAAAGLACLALNATSVLGVMTRRACLPASQIRGRRTDMTDPLITKLKEQFTALAKLNAIAPKPDRRTRT